MKSTNDHKYSINEVENILTKMFKGKRCSFTRPGKETIYGIVSAMAIDTKVLPQKEVLIFIDHRRYSVSIECLHECLKIINGNIRATDCDNGEGPC